MTGSGRPAGGDRRSLRSLASNDGFSLIEAVVACMIFAALVLSLTRSMLNTRKAATLSGNSSVAATLALDRLEQLRTLASTSSDMSAGTHNDSSNPLRADGTTGGTFTRQWIVTDDVPTAGMKRLEMRITWRDRTGSNLLRLVTLAMP